MLLPPSCIEKVNKEQAWCFNRWSELPDDLQVEILCRLPVKPLIRLKCISKSLYFLISNRCAPRISSTTFYGLLYTFEILETSELCLHFSLDWGYPPAHTCPPQLLTRLQYYLDSLLPFQHTTQDFRDCCNGLLLLSRCAQYYVCNLLTFECISIPLNPNHVNEESIYGASLLFDPSKSNSPNSFWIIVPSEDTLQHSLKLDVFSSVFGNWSSHIIHLDTALDGFKFVDRCIYFNGILYMLSLAKYLVGICVVQDETNNASVSYRAIELPGKDEFDCCGCFGTSQGSLVYSNSNYSKILVWMLQDGISWVLQHTISVDDLMLLPRAKLLFLLDREDSWEIKVDELFRLDRDSWEIKVYGFHPCSEDIFMGTSSRVSKYNPRTNKLELYSALGSSRKIVCGKYKVFPLMSSAVILDSVIKEA